MSTNGELAERLEAAGLTERRRVVITAATALITGARKALAEHVAGLIPGSDAARVVRCAGDPRPADGDRVNPYDGIDPADLAELSRWRIGARTAAAWLAARPDPQQARAMLVRLLDKPARGGAASRAIAAYTDWRRLINLRLSAAA